MKKLILIAFLLVSCGGTVVFKDYAGKVKIISGKFITTDLNHDYWADRNFKAKKGDSVWLVDTNKLMINSKKYILK